jgi:uncharacterized cupredoxin-like copper-binding protein
MLVLAACSRDGSTASSSTSSANTASGAQNVQVALSDYKVASSTTTFTAGTQYHFVVTNNGQTAHEFMVMQPMSMGNMPMSQMDKMAFAHISNINPGQTQTINYTFPSSSASQSLELACHLPGHYEQGMKLPVKVNK